MIEAGMRNFVIQSEVKKGDSSLPKHKDIGKKTLKVLAITVMLMLRFEV